MKRFSQKKLDQFKKAFEDKRDAIMLSIKKTDRNLDVDGDDIDIVQGALISGLVDKLSERDMKTIHKISQAIEKIDAGDFGLCEECGDAIGEKRLLAVPGIDTCINCAEEQERNQKQYRAM